jgi:hypothetical protein
MCSFNRIAFCLIAISSWLRPELSLADEVKIVVPKELATREGDAMGWDFAIPAAHSQWLYDASQFGEVPAGYTLLTGIATRPDASVKSARTIRLSDVELRLSTTSVKPNEQDWTFANNLGDDVTLVHDGRFEGKQHGTGPADGPREFDYIIPFLRPFAYDPSRGNLLVDWQLSPHNAPLLLDGDSSVAEVGSEVASQSGAHVTQAEYEQSLLLVTQFTFASPSGDYDLNGLLDARDINALSAAARTGGNDLAFDLNADRRVNEDDRTAWVRTFKKTWFGDADLDGLFGSGDLVTVFQAGQYEDAVALNSAWETGDWNGNGDFETGDLVVAFQDGGYERGVRVPRSRRCPSRELAPCSVLDSSSRSSITAVFVGRCRRGKT